MLSMCTLFERATRNPCGQDNMISLVTIKLCKVTCNPCVHFLNEPLVIRLDNYVRSHVIHVYTF